MGLEDAPLFHRDFKDCGCEVIIPYIGEIEIRECIEHIWKVKQVKVRK